MGGDAWGADLQATIMPSPRGPAGAGGLVWYLGAIIRGVGYLPDIIGISGLSI